MAQDVVRIRGPGGWAERKGSDDGWGMSCLEKHGILYGCFRKWHFLCHPFGSAGRHKVMMAKRGEWFDYMLFPVIIWQACFAITTHILYCVVLRLCNIYIFFSIWMVKPILLNVKWQQKRHICSRVDWNSPNMLSSGQIITRCLPNFVYYQSCFLLLLHVNYSSPLGKLCLAYFLFWKRYCDLGLNIFPSKPLYFFLRLTVYHTLPMLVQTQTQAGLHSVPLSQKDKTS